MKSYSLKTFMVTSVVVFIIDADPGTDPADDNGGGC